MLGDREKRMAAALESKYGEKVARAFRGGIEVLYSASEDKVAQSAHSLREVLDMIVKADKGGDKRDDRLPEEEGDSKKDTRFARDLDAVMIPGRRKLPDDTLYKKIVKNRVELLRIAHHGTPPPADKYRRTVDEFEELLEDYLKPHFDALESLEPLMKIQHPTKADLEKLGRLISKNASLYDHFFQNAGPGWLGRLAEAGYFSRPHPRYTPRDRGISVDRTQAAHLARHAKKMPERAAKLIAGIVEGEGTEADPLVQMHAVRAALDIHPKHAREIARLLLPSKRTGHPLQHSVVKDDVAELAARLAEAGHIDDGIKLARALLSVAHEPQPSAQQAGRGAASALRRVEPAIGSYFFSRVIKDTVPRLFAAAPAPTMDMLAQCLAGIVHRENAARPGSSLDTDLSIYWRPAMEDHQQNRPPNFKSDLAGKMAELLVEAGRRSIPELEDSLKPLAAKRYPVFRRLELHAYRHFPEEFAARIRVAVGACFGRAGLRHEYFFLLRSCFPSLPETDRKAYLVRVIAGPGDDFVRRASEFERAGRRPPAEAAVRHWKATMLAPVRGHLSREERELLGGLAAEEEPAHADFAVHRSVSRAGAGDAQLGGGMEPDADVEAVRTYAGGAKDFGSGHGTPKKFEEYCSSNAEEYSARATGMAGLRPDLRAAFLRGMKAALRKGKKINWDSVLGLCQAAVDSIVRGDAHLDDEAEALDAAADLLRYALRKGRIGESQAPAVWGLLEGMASLGEVVDGALQEAALAQADGDAMTVAVNSLGGMVFLAMGEYAAWRSGREGEKPGLAPEVKRLLSDYFDGKIPHTLPKHAAIGHLLPLLYWCDKEWIGGRARGMLGGAGALARAAWSGYLAASPDWESFGDMVEMYRADVLRAAAPPAGGAGLASYSERLVEHVTQGHLLGMGDAGGVFDEMVKRAGKNARSHCAWTIYLILKEHRKSPYESFNLEGFRKAWKGNRLGRHGFLALWVEFSPLGPEETLGLLHEALKSGGGDVGAMPMLLVKQLRRFAGEHPDMVLVCLEDMTRDEALHEEIMHGRDELPGVLGEVYGGCSNRGRAAALIHRLGEMGYNECRGILGGGTGTGAA